MTEQVVTQDVPQGADQVVNPSATDPFSLDENSLVSLSPEQRASLDPIIDTWKKKATDEISRRDSEIEKYKAYGEKATALDKLTQYQPFVQWWQTQQQQAQSGAQTNSQAQAIGQTKPNDIASQQEWQEAIYEASQGDGGKLQGLQARMLSTWATPLVNDLKNKQKELDTRLEMRDLFEDHPDAKNLDSIGLDPKTKEGTSLLEMCLDWADKNGKTMEDGYNMAKSWRDSMSVSAQQQAMGLIQDKKQATTAGQSTSSSSGSVVEVESIDELMRRSMDAQLTGDKNSRFVLKK